MSTVAIDSQTGPLAEAEALLHPATHQNALTPAIDFIGGVAGGTASVYVGQSLDTVKVKMQTFPHLYKNATDCFVRTWREEGLVRGLYAGTLPSLAAQVSENAVLFMAYGMCQRALATLLGKRDVSQLNPVQNALAGGSAAFFSSLVLCPTELIKCRLQAMEQLKETGQLQGSLKERVERKRVGPWGLTKQIVKTNGYMGLFRGFVPTLYREMPGYFFFFGGYELSRHLLTPKGQNKEDLSPLRTIISGGIGGMSLWIAVFPADVIKSRVQVQGNVEMPFFKMMTHIARNEGIRALYRGLGPNLLRTIPATGALFLAFETVKKIMTSRPDEESEY